MKRQGILVLFALLTMTATLWSLHLNRLAARQARARAEMEELKKAIGIYSSLGNPFREHPVDFLRPMTRTVGDTDIDPWGHEYIIETVGQGVTVTCFGADGYPGGEGADEDIVLHWTLPEDRSSR